METSYKDMVKWVYDLQIDKFNQVYMEWSNIPNDCCDLRSPYLTFEEYAYENYFELWN